MTNITTKIALEVASHELLMRKAYKDSVDKWTWSVGMTNATGHNVERYIDNPQTVRKCLEIYLWALSDYNEDVTEAFAGHTLTQAQRAAALSFHWNTGAIKRAAWVGSFMAGNKLKAHKQFMNYKTPSSIIERREKERDLFFDGVWSNNGKMGEITKLSSRYQPIWRSRIEIDVADVIEGILNPTTDAVKEAAKPRGIMEWLFG